MSRLLVSTLVLLALFSMTTAQNCSYDVPVVNMLCNNGTDSWDCCLNSTITTTDPNCTCMAGNNVTCPADQDQCTTLINNLETFTNYTYNGYTCYKTNDTDYNCCSNFSKPNWNLDNLTCDGNFTCSNDTTCNATIDTMTCNQTWNATISNFTCQNTSSWECCANGQVNTTGDCTCATGEGIMCGDEANCTTAINQIETFQNFTAAGWTCYTYNGTVNNSWTCCANFTKPYATLQNMSCNGTPNITCMNETDCDSQIANQKCNLTWNQTIQNYKCQMVNGSNDTNSSYSCCVDDGLDVDCNCTANNGFACADMDNCTAMVNMWNSVQTYQLMNWTCYNWNGSNLTNCCEDYNQTAADPTSISCTGNSFNCTSNMSCNATAADMLCQDYWNETSTEFGNLNFSCMTTSGGDNLTNASYSCCYKGGETVANGTNGTTDCGCATGYDLSCDGNSSCIFAMDNITSYNQTEIAGYQCYNTDQQNQWICCSQFQMGWFNLSNLECSGNVYKCGSNDTAACAAAINGDNNKPTSAVMLKIASVFVVLIAYLLL